MESKDIKKTEVKRKYTPKRKRVRRRKIPLFIYSLIILILVFILFATLSTTVLFNIKYIYVTGNVDCYSDDDIVAKSGIVCEENMVKLDSSEAEQKIVDSFPYIESAKIVKHFPNNLEIQVTKCAESFDVTYDGGVLAVSKLGKIIDVKDTTTDGMIVINGFEPSTTKAGSTLHSTDSQKDKIFSALSDVLSKQLKVKVDNVDITDKYDITVQFDSRIIFEAGSWSDIDYKINLAETSITELESTAKGYLRMVGTNQVSFRTAQLVKDTQERAQERLAEQESEEQASETTSEVNSYAG